MIKDFIKGIVIGIGNIVPGVSGGMLAIVMNIFDDLIFAINNIFKDFKTQFKFLLPIFLGAVFGIGVFSKILGYTLEYFSMPSAMLFAGLILGTIPLLWEKSSQNGFKPTYLIYSVVSLVIVIIVSHLGMPTSQSAEIVVTSSLVFQIFLCGVFSAAAMIVPGVSGSSVMLLMGMYYFIIQTISDFISAAFSFDIDAAISTMIILVPLAIGIVVGVILISKILLWLLQRAYQATYYSILGLTLGSVYTIFIDPGTYVSGVTVFSIIASIFTGVIGTVIALKLGRDE